MIAETLFGDQPDPMIARERARLARLDADPGVVAAREAYVARLDAYDAARRDLEAASGVLAEETARVLDQR